MLQKINKSILLVSLITSLLVSSGGMISINAQPTNSTHIPILLIHGYGERSNIWTSWVNQLKEDNFMDVYTANFTNDRCGSSEEHAEELDNLVNEILVDTGSKELNLVAHSKGGLDARWYIANSHMDKVANLIMVGTPNGGSPAAWLDLSGCPFGSDFDLFRGSAATEVLDKPNSSNYYTITGNWNPTNRCWVFGFWVTDGGSCLIKGPDDGLVPVDSVNSSPNYIPIGEPFPYDHFALVDQRAVYEAVLPILEGR
jgi:pimeloyl-ACP methyl ester carboxylesterase